MPGRRSVLLGLFALVAGVAPAHGEPPAPEPAPLTVEPARVEIGLLYSGVDLEVSAETEPGVDVAVLVIGPASDLRMREQTRRWGLFWAPAGELSFHDVPSLYLLRTTVGLDELAPSPVLEELGIGYAALRARLGGETRDDLFRELTILRESEGLFSSTVARDEDRGTSAAHGSSFRAVMHVPARAPADTYSVRLWAFREGRVVTRAEDTFELEEAGFVEFVSTLAETHGLAYGIFAVVVAVASGLLVGFLFGSTRKKA